MTARELASRFETSQHTIYRDMEALSLAGIPIVSFHGSEGGLGLTENFTKASPNSILAFRPGDGFGSIPSGQPDARAWFLRDR